MSLRQRTSQPKRNSCHISSKWHLRSRRLSVFMSKKLQRGSSHRQRESVLTSLGPSMITCLRSHLTLNRWHSSLARSWTPLSAFLPCWRRWENSEINQKTRGSKPNHKLCSRLPTLMTSRLPWKLRQIWLPSQRLILCQNLCKSSSKDLTAHFHACFSFK